MNFIKTVYHSLERDLAARKMRGKKDVTVIGLTGSQGKTSTAAVLTEVLSEKFSVIQTDLNLDPIFAIPRLVRKLKKEKIAVVELAVDKPGQMKSYLKMIQPKFGILTGIAPVHTDSEHLGSLEGVMKEKSELLKALPMDGVGFVNWDDQRVQQMSKETRARIVKYGMANESDVKIISTKVKLSGTEVVLEDKGKQIHLSTKLIGKQHCYTLAAAFAVASELGLNENEIQSALGKVAPLPGRMSVEAGPAGVTILNDARRANLASTLAGLETFGEISAKRKIAILGPMAEMGDYEEAGHREVGKKAGEVKLDYLICVGGASRFVADEAMKALGNERVFYVEDVFAAAEKLKQITKPGDLWYLKGSLLKHLERIPLILQGKKVDPDEIASHRYEVYR